MVGLLADYLEGRLPERARHDLERHLSGCRRCEEYLETYRSTVHLLRSLTDDDLPPELRLRVRAFLDRRSGN